MDTQANWIAIDKRTWRFEDEGVRFFLLLGAEKALLVDSGMTVSNARDLACQLTDMPIMLFNTHCDPDHVAGNGQFDEVFVSPAELVHPAAPKYPQTVHPVWNGDVIDLGNRELEAIALPGHTPGSTALLDRATGMLFSGDPIQRDGRIFMFGPMRNLAAYIASLQRLKRWEGRVTSIWPSHAVCPVDFAAVDELYEGACAVQKGEAPYSDEEVHGCAVRAYDVGPSILLCDRPE